VSTANNTIKKCEGGIDGASPIVVVFKYVFVESSKTFSFSGDRLSFLL
jgi:hypothetical protein